jgi:hypothetical protein
VALEQVWIYRMEIGLAVFYGALLIITPAVIGISRGRLPTEISARGAKFGEEVAASEAKTKKRFEKLEARLEETETSVNEAVLR